MAGLADKFPSWVSPALTSGGTMLSAGSQIVAGIGARRAGDAAASMADIGSGNALAASQRVAQEEDRHAKAVASRAQAVAAASGAGTGGTVHDVISGIAKEGAYRSQLALYNGEERARILKQQAANARYEGQAKQRAGFIGSIGTILKGGSTLFSKYAPRNDNYGTIDPTAAGAGLDENLPY